MKIAQCLPMRITCALILVSTFTLPARAADDRACLGCHGQLSQKKVVHAAIDRGCVACHSEIDATAVPHKSKGGNAKGLAAEPPALCNKCHERKLFEGKVVHAPVGGALCVTCHDPHGSDQPGLLKKAPAAVCLDCHPDVKKKPHVVAGISRRGHPLGNEGSTKDVEDPLRPGKRFYCVSCHEPHRSEQPMLLRYGKGMISCQRCHKV